MIEFKHLPIMLNEVIDGLNIKKDGVYLDCTVGGAGHSKEIAKRLDGGMLLCLDKDEDALSVSKERLKSFNAKFFHTDFKDFETALNYFGVQMLDGILLDLGVSSYQLDCGERGFSYNIDAPLDMRMDKTQKLTAKDVVNTYEKSELARIFREYGEEQFANNIAKHIAIDREKKPIETTFELAEIIKKAIPAKIRFKGSHPAKKVFQAIRIEVNSELDKLKETIIKLFRHLKPSGRLAIITFHSLEDRIVKTAFNELSKDCLCPPSVLFCVCGHKKEGILLNKKPIIPSESELKENSRSHSAKLRIIEKL